MNLHIIQTSAGQQQSSTNAIALIQPTDKVIFIDDGVYNTLAETSVAEKFIQTGAQCLVLEEHLLSRGFQNCHQRIKKTSMSEFVTHTFNAKHNISWY